MAFRDLVNQEHAVMLLRSAARRQRPAHAYLVVGPQGVGRRALALAFAQYLNCKHPDELDADGTCSHCRRITEGNHPDVRVLDINEGRFLVPTGREGRERDAAAEDGPFGRRTPRMTQIPIDQIRALKQDAYYPPYEARWKVYVIADAELLSPGAANSLLKVLEEPPPNVVIILIVETTLPLPATIVSRCQLVHCGLSSPREIERALMERHGVARNRARFLAALAAGRIGRAVAWATSDDLLRERDRFLDLLVRLETADPIAKLDAAEELAKEKDRLSDLLEIAAFWYRDLMVWKESGDRELIVNLDRREPLDRLAATLSWEALRRRYDAVEHAKESLAMNVQPRLALERLFFEIGRVEAPA